MREPMALALTLLLVLSCTLACTTSYPPCYRGEYRGCTCAGATAKTGYAACNVTEDGFQTCSCDGTTPGADSGARAGSGDAGGEGGGAEGGDDAGAAYLAPCGPNDACAGADALCFEFGTKGKTCTKHCTQSTDCPPPSPGCSPAQGICRAP